MTIKVIKDAYYVSEDLTSIGMVNKDEFESSFSHVLVVGDIWESIEEQGHWNDINFKCIEGKWEGDENDGWWDYKDNEGYFIVME
jgi:hypothetical protein